MHAISYFFCEIFVGQMAGWPAVSKEIKQKSKQNNDDRPGNLAKLARRRRAHRENEEKWARRRRAHRENEEKMARRRRAHKENEEKWRAPKNARELAFCIGNLKKMLFM